jgi:transaldolase
LDSGTLERYIKELSVTGLTSNPTIFDHAIKNSTAYNAAICEKIKKGKSGEELFFELALDDLTRAARMFRQIYDQTNARLLEESHHRRNVATPASIGSNNLILITVGSGTLRKSACEKE